MSDSPVSPEPQIHRWGHSAEVRANENLSSEGMWELRWDDGLFCVVTREGDSREWMVRPDSLMWARPVGSPIKFTLVTPTVSLPRVLCSTRRELVQVLTDWRAREIRAARDAGA